MKYKNQSQLVRAFLRNEKGMIVNNLRTEDRGSSIALVHFDTIIAQYVYETKILHCNITNYGVSTSRVQRLLKTYIPYTLELGIQRIIEFDNQVLHQKSLSSIKC